MLDGDAAGRQTDETRYAKLPLKMQNLLNFLSNNDSPAISLVLNCIN